MTHVLENKVLERRVAVCKINDCCPFRSNLCHVADGCHGLISDRSITGDDKDTNDKDFAMVTLDDETVFLVNGALTMFANSPSNAALLRDFDRGADMTKYIEQQLTYEPLPKGHKPARLKKALEAGEIML
jgi:hypothetical protein